MFHISRKSHVLSFVTCITVLTSIIGLAVSATTVQSPPFAQQIPTTDKPKISVYGASNISITEWDKSEVSITGNDATQKLNAGDVTVLQRDDKMNIQCHSDQSGKAISINLIIPKQAVVTVITQDGRIEIREPVEPTAVQLTHTTVELSVPVNAKMDLKDVAYAQWYRLLGPGGYSINYASGKVIGLGPPYLKVSRTNAQVIINRSPVLNATGGPVMNAGGGQSRQLTVAAQSRPLTIAAQMIALRGGVMATSLRKSEPRLSDLKKDIPSGAAHKEDDSGDVTLRSQLVNLNVTVTDRDGRSIAGLKQGDFSVYEDGVLQKIQHFAPEQTPFNLVLLLDMSGSVATKRDLIIQAALHFIDVIGPQDKVAVIVFTTDVLVLSHLTQDREDLRDSITNLVLPTGGTSFYDALGYSLAEELRKVRKQRNAIVVLTDGEDNALLYQNLARVQPVQSVQSNIYGPSNITIRSGAQPVIGSFLTFDELLDGVRESDALIYPVHIDTSQDTGSNAPFNTRRGQREMDARISRTARSQLQDLADASGGRVYNAEQIEDIAKIYDQVAAEMRTVYSLAYAPSNTAIDGKLRLIKVKINRPETVARTRPGYYPR